jgi:hypothetical protein
MEGTGGGEVRFYSSATHCVVTWSNMRSYGIATPRFSFQLMLEPSGIIHCIYGPGVTNNSTFGGVSDNGICGATPAGGITLPAASDLSAGGLTANNSLFESWVTANTFDLANNTLMMVPTNPGYTYLLHGAPSNCASATSYGSGCDGVTLTGIGLPSVGNSSFTLRVSNVPAVSPIALVGFGTVVVNPGTPLDPIGMPGCAAYTDLGIGLFSSGPVVAGTSDYAAGVPNNLALLGVTLSTQAVTFSTATAALLATSNGVQVTIGYGAP